MARGRGITLQLEDDTVDLTDWNRPGGNKGPLRMPGPAPLRKPGGYPPLAANFQNDSRPRQLVTPASLMSASGSVEQDASFSDDDNDDSNDDEEEEESFGDSDDEFVNDKVLLTMHNGNNSIPKLERGSSSTSGDEELHSEEDDPHEVEDAIASLEEINRKERGFSYSDSSSRRVDMSQNQRVKSENPGLLETDKTTDRSRKADVSRDQKSKTPGLMETEKTTGASSPSSDKENREVGRKQGERNGAPVRSLDQSPQQSGSWYKKKDIPLEEPIPKLKQPLSEKGSQSRTSPAVSPPRRIPELRENQRITTSPMTGKSPGRGKGVDYSSEPPARISPDPSLGYVSPSEPENKFCGGKGIGGEMPKLSPEAPVFVPRGRPTGARNHPWVGSGDGQTLPWSTTGGSLHHSHQQQHPDPVHHPSLRGYSDSMGGPGNMGNGYMNTSPSIGRRGSPTRNDGHLVPSGRQQSMSDPSHLQVGFPSEPERNFIVNIREGTRQGYSSNHQDKSDNAANYQAHLGARQQAFSPAPSAGFSSRSSQFLAGPRQRIPRAGPSQIEPRNNPPDSALSVRPEGDTMGLSSSQEEPKNVLPREGMSDADSKVPTEPLTSRLGFDGGPPASDSPGWHGQMQGSPVPLSSRWTRPKSTGSPKTVGPSQPVHDPKYPPEIRRHEKASTHSSQGHDSRKAVTMVDPESQKPGIQGMTGGGIAWGPAVPSLSDIEERKKLVEAASRVDAKPQPTTTLTKGKKPSVTGSGSHSPVGRRLGRLSVAEQENEYEWRKYKLVQKVKKALKKFPETDAPEVANQLRDIVVQAGPSFEAFESQPKELAIAIEEVLIHAVSERKCISILQELCVITENFHGQLRIALEQVESQFIQAFIGAHLEKKALDYCGFLAQLYGSFPGDSPTCKMLGDYLTNMAHEWITPSEKGNSSGLVEESNIKCLRALMSELGPNFPGWASILDGVRKQIFGSRSQNVKELFLEILLHAEGLSKGGSGGEERSNVTLGSCKGDSGRGDASCTSNPEKSPTKEAVDCSRVSSMSSTEGIPQVSTKPPEKGKIDKDATPADTSPYLSPYNDSMKATYLSTKLKSPPVTQDPQKDLPSKDKHISRNSAGLESGSKSDGGRLTKEVPDDWWDFDAASSEMVIGALQEEIDKIVVETSEKELSPDLGGVDSGLGESSQDARRQPAAENGSGTTSSDDASILRNFPVKDGSESGKTVAVASGGKVAVATGGKSSDCCRPPTKGTYPSSVGRQNTPIQNGNGGCGAPSLSNQQEVWDEELMTNPTQDLYTIPKRRIDGTSLRYQREHYVSNIGSAMRTYEVCGRGDPMSQTGGGVDHSERQEGGIVQEDDDVIILEETSESGSEEDDVDDDDDVPLIWGDVTPGRAPEVTPQGEAEGEAQSQQGPPGQEIQGYAQAPWNQPRRMMVFREEADTEPHLSGVEILAQQKLHSRRLFGRQVSWSILNKTRDESEVD